MKDRRRRGGNIMCKKGTVFPRSPLLCCSLEQGGEDSSCRREGKNREKKGLAFGEGPF